MEGGFCVGSAIVMCMTEVSQKNNNAFFNMYVTQCHH